MANFESFAATLLEIYSLKHWQFESAKISQRIASLTGADRATMTLAREACGPGCGQPAPDHFPLSGGKSSSHNGNSDTDVQVRDECIVCSASDWETGPDLPHICIKLEFRSKDPARHETARRLVSSLLPHLRRAYQLTNPECGPGQTSGMVSTLLETFSGKMAIITRTGRLVDCNRAFNAALTNALTVAIDPEGHVAFTAPLDQQDFLGALATPGPTAFFTKEQGLEPMVVSVHPIKQTRFEALRTTSPAGDEDGELLLMWVRPKQPEGVSLAFLQALFGLTRAETRVTEYVVQGLTLEEVAERIGVSKITARNQLTSAMSKLGVNRQAQLVTLILNMFPRLSGT